MFMRRNIFAIGIFFLFVISSISPIVFNNVKATDKEIDIENYNFDRYLYPEYYDCYNVDEIPSSVDLSYREFSGNENIVSEIVINPDSSPLSSDGLMDSAWPMYCHDVHHTGRSPYSTVDIWDEIWRFKTYDYVRGSPIIGDDGTIYFQGFDESGCFYALYPNGTMKWKYDDLEYYVWSAPVIDDSGVIYVGDLDGYFYAINHDGTEKWKTRIAKEILSSPVIGNDGIIYIGTSFYYPNGYIYAIYSDNGSVKWSYKTDHVVYSSPAIGEDGIIYCGSHDSYLYALYPNNGTLKWKYKTDGWIRVSPCIGDDGTIYCVSFDCYLHAINPDGTLKWKTYMGNAGTTPTIGQDGTIYCGYKKLYAINPTNGSVKWTFNVDGTIQGSTPAHSLEDTIYFGAGTYLYAVNPDGTLKWRKQICNEFIDSAPAISSDGTIYVGTADSENHGGNIYSVGYLHAIGIGELKADANGPYYGLINEPVQFKGSSSGGYSPHSYHWNFGNGGSSNEQNPTHTYTEADNYSVTLTVTDKTGNTSSDITYAWIQTSNTPPGAPIITGETNGDAGTSYDYTFTATDPESAIIWYYIDWGDSSNTGWIGPYNSGEQIPLSHSWSKQGTYIIKGKAKDPYNEEGPEGTLTVIMPKNKAINFNSLFLKLLEQFPNTFPLLKQLLRLK